MPIEWIPIVAKAALGSAASTAVKEAYGGAKEKVSSLLSDALSKGPLAEPLESAYREAFTGFRGALAIVFPMDEDIELGLSTLARHEDFVAAVGRLPYVPFEKIDTTRARELFLNLLGSLGMGERHFEMAWSAFGLRFELAAAKDQGLKNLLDLTWAARKERRDEDQLRHLEDIRKFLQRLAESAEAAARTPDPEPAIRKYREALYQRYRYADTDEVFDEHHRRWVSDEVWRLVSRFPEARFVLTSRPHGYQAAPLPGPVQRWQLQPFGNNEIGRFSVAGSRRWRELEVKSERRSLPRNGQKHSPPRSSLGRIFRRWPRILSYVH
jgi:hypothetical protein